MQKKEKIAVIAGVVLLVILTAVFSFYAVKNSNPGKQGWQASGSSVQPADKNQKEIPAEATTSCQGKSEGDSCEATMPKKTEKVVGSCKKMGSASQLTCLPANMPVGGPGAGGGVPPINGGPQKQ